MRTVAAHHILSRASNCRSQQAPRAEDSPAMSQPNQYELLKQRRFLPFFLTQFLGAFNDNVYKNALVILVAYHAASLSRLDANTLSNLAQALFILPFFLFSATAGQLADKLEKSFLIRWEIGRASCR